MQKCIVGGISNSFRCLVVASFVGGLAGCGDADQQELPACEEGEVLFRTQGAWTCGQSDLPSGCEKGEALIWDGDGWTCVVPESIPACGEGELLARDSDGWTCMPQPSLPECEEGEVLVAKEDGWSCEPQLHLECWEEEVIAKIDEEWRCVGFIDGGFLTLANLARSQDPKVREGVAKNPNAS